MRRKLIEILKRPELQRLPDALVFIVYRVRLVEPAAVSAVFLDMIERFISIFEDAVT